MTVDIDSKIIKKLDKQEKEEGNLPLLWDFYRKLLHIQSKAAKRIGTSRPGLSSEAINEQINDGLPLLDFNNLALDLPLLQEVFVDVVAAFADYPKLFGEVPEKLIERKSSRLLTKKAVKAWLQGKTLPATILAGSDKENLMQAIIHATLKPFLANYARALIKLVDQEQWRRRYCPICGGSPDFSFLDKERGARYLLCSRCDTAWIFQRLECPYCGNKDQANLAYFTNDEGLYRFFVCEQCKNYLKAIDLQQSKSEVLLPLERLYTLDIDSQAQQQGYHPYGKPAAEKAPEDRSA
ncbi:formate dehydrogenase accessory protein FdhE [Chloroflexota bacterium]